MRSTGRSRRSRTRASGTPPRLAESPCIHFAVSHSDETDVALELRSGDLSHQIERTADGFLLDGEPIDLGIETLREVSPGVATYVLVVENRPQVVTVETHGAETRVTIGGIPVDVQIKTETDQLLEKFGMDTGDADAAREVRAPMPGMVLRMLVEEGQAVSEGEGLVVLEAMKMENELKAGADGVVAKTHAAAGDAVAKNDLLVSFE